MNEERIKDTGSFARGKICYEISIQFRKGSTRGCN